MLWDPARWDHDLRAAVQRYIALRKKYAAVWRGGAYVHLYAQGMVYVFARQRDRHTRRGRPERGHQRGARSIWMCIASSRTGPPCGRSGVGSSTR